jgi:hypothetical protein
MLYPINCFFPPLSNAAGEHILIEKNGCLGDKACYKASADYVRVNGGCNANYGASNYDDFTNDAKYDF